MTMMSDKEVEAQSGRHTAGCLLWMWEGFMALVSIVYSIIIMYEYNRTGVHIVPTAPPPPVVMAGSPSQVGANLPRRLATLNPCDTDLEDWNTWPQSIVNITAVTAIVLILDQVKTIAEIAWRKCNIWYYLAYPDNLFNLATTGVQAFSAIGDVVPNAVGQVSRQCARLIAGIPAPRNPRDLEQYGEFDKYICDRWWDGAWEAVVVFVVSIEFLQAIAMPFLDCQSGPTLAVSTVGKPAVNFHKWDEEDHVLVNVAFILSIFFIVNVFVELCQWKSMLESMRDASKIHYMIIALQTTLMQCGLPVPTALGRLVKPSFIFLGCLRTHEYRTIDAKTAADYENALAEYKSHKTLAPEEGEGRGCINCTKGAVDRWTC